MKLWEVNLWVYAFRADSPLHGKARASMQASLDRREGFVFNPGIAASFLRLVTNPRIFAIPSELSEAWLFVDTLESHPASFHAELDAMAFGVFKHLCLASNAVGNYVPDALLAALAIRHGATLVSADRGFERFSGLRFEPLE
jgi:hypothetical protein